MEKDRGQLAVLAPYLKPYLLSLLAVFFLILLSTAGNLLLTRYNGLALDAALAQNWHGFLTVVKSLLLAMLFMLLFSHLQYLLANHTAERIVFNLRQDIAEKLGTVDYAELERRHSGDYISRLSSDFDLVSVLVSSHLPNLFSSMISVAAALVYLLFISWRVIVFGLILAPIALVIANVMSKPLGDASRQHQEKLAGVNALAQDATGGIVVSKAFSLKNYLVPRFHSRAADAAAAAVNLAYRSGRLQAAMMTFNNIPLIALYGLGGYEVIRGRMTVGSLIIMASLFGRIITPLQSIGNTVAQIKAALAAAERIFELLELPSERKSGKPLSKQADYPYAIEMKGVKFSYGKEPVFTDLSLTVRQGETVAIVGPSGAGKSTLFLLLLGLRNPEAGEILFFGQSLVEISLADLRRSIAYVAQESLLFPVSVAENIGYGKEDATRTEIEQAARLTHAEEFIVRLPRGYDTELGELGTGLSGGQKQRLCLARAVLKDAPILLLDEATSSLDTEAEAKVQAALELIAENKTTLIIAHRLSTIINADRIVVIDKGRVVEEGTHEGLLAAGGTYATLYAAQFETQQRAQAAGQ